MSTLLVTGGAGFIGGTFVRMALSAGDTRIVNLDRLTYAGNLDSLAPCLDDPRHRFVHGDIGDAALVRRLLDEHRPRAIVNFAAESHVDRSIDGPREFVRTNVDGVVELLQCAVAYHRTLDGAARAEFRFLQISTDEVYGSAAPGARFTEASPFQPNSPYAASKAAADHFVRAFHRTYGLPALITNCSNNYGPHQFPEKLIPLMILNALEGRPLPVYGDGQNVRDWIFVEDHCRALQDVLARGRPGETYNIGGDCERANLDMVETICDAVDALRPGLPHAPCRSAITFVADRPGHDRRYAVDAGKIARELGFTPRVTLDEGLRATVAWYLANPVWVERVTSGTYRRERLGLGAAPGEGAR